MTSKPLSTSSGGGHYMPHLDSLRAFAVASVAISHWVPKEYHGGLPLGPAGVQLFFVLSGFLISGILLRARAGADSPADRRGALASFYARRFLRIFPLYYVVLAALLLLGIPVVRESIWWHVSYLSNIYFFLENRWVHPVAHFWSLAVEEQFYLLFPFVVMFTPSRWLRAVFLAPIAIGVISRFGLPWLAPERKIYSALLISNLDALGLGSMLAFLSGQEARRCRFATSCSLGLPIFVILSALQKLEVGISDSLAYGLRHTAMLMAFVWIVDRGARGWTGFWARTLACRLILYLGKISYGLYVLHNLADIPVHVVANVTGLVFLKEGWSGVAAQAFFTVAGAALSWHVLEGPLNSLKRRFPYVKGT